MIGFGQRKPRVGRFAQRVPEAKQRTPLRRPAQMLVVLVAYVIIVAALTRLPESEKMLVADMDAPIASTEIRTAFYFEAPNLKATQQAREEAREKVPPHYRIDQDLVNRQLSIVRNRITRIREQRPAIQNAILETLRQSDSTQRAEDIVQTVVATHVAALKETPEWADLPEAAALNLWLTPDKDSLPKRQFAPPAETPPAEVETEGEAIPPQELPRPVIALQPEEVPPFFFSLAEHLETLALESLRYVLHQGVRTAAMGGDKEIVILRDMLQDDQHVSSQLAMEQVPDVEEAAEVLSQRLQETAKSVALELQVEWAKLHDAGLPMVQPALVDTIRYDKVFMAGALERASESIAPVMKSIEPGEIIQDRGKRWTAQSRSDVNTYLSILENEQKPQQRIINILLSHMILAAMVLTGLFRSMGLLRGENTETYSLAHVNLALLLMCITLIVGRIALYFQPTGYLLPVAAVGILYAVLVSVRLAAMLSILIALLVSAQYGYDWRLFFVLGAMSLAGVFSIYKVRRRSDMAAASIKATLVGLFAMAAILLATNSLVAATGGRRLLLIALNGGVCLLTVPGLLSPFERLFGITTDIQLLEYSDLNNEVMSQLAIKAPATYAHSLMLGQLAEAAADAVGANGLLARVCAYYHDIGKMWRSEYFSENQQGYNIHDELAPRLSARAIASHVLKGVEMARNYHLPKPIVDGILEHHGTCLIGFFYQQALEQNKHDDVREEDFRYPGPKPQSPETAILMICDAVESGVRSIKNPNEERIREFVEKIVAARSEGRQFDDSNLTLKQLDTIKEVVSRRIITMLHTRVSYPDADKDSGKNKNVIPLSGGA